MPAKLYLLIPSILMLCLSARTGVAATLTFRQQLDFDTRDQFETAYRCMAIDLHSASGSVRLTPLETFRPSVAYAMIHDTIPPKGLGRVDFDLTNGVPGGGELLLYGSGSSVAVNGTSLPLTALPPGGWFQAEIPAGILKEGINSIILPPGLRIGRDPQATPSQSSFLRATQTAEWEPADGEYLMRLRVFRHPPAGLITSEVIDLLNPEEPDSIAPAANVTEIRVRADTRQPRGTGIRIETRTGAAPQPDDNWTAWSPTLQPEPGRFLQWRAQLTTSRPRRTPELRGISIEARLRRSAVAAKNPPSLTEWDAPRIARTGQPFTFQEPSPKLERLRIEWDLDGIVANATNQLDAFIKLRNWARNHWPHNDAGARDRTWDAIDILTAPEGQKGMCSHFGVLYTQSALALGYVSRHIILNGHFVAEIWSDDLRQWILMDVETVQTEGWERYGTAMYRDIEDGRPLDILDLHRAVINQTTSNIVQELAMHDDTGTHQVYPRFYGPDQFSNFQRFALPKRNNYLDQLEPWEQSWGFNHYFSDAFLWWRNEPLGHTPQFTWLTDREGDVRWDVNTTAIYLTALPETGRLEVWFDTVTPNFASFQIRRNGGEWESLNAPGPQAHERQLRWAWELEPGENRLEVRARNRFDRDGAISTVTLTLAKENINE